MEFLFKDEPEIKVTNNLVIRTLLMEGVEKILKDSKNYGDYMAAGKIFEKNATKMRDAGNLGQGRMFLWDALGCYVHAKRSASIIEEEANLTRTKELIRDIRNMLKISGMDEIFLTMEKFEGHALVYAALLRN